MFHTKVVNELTCPPGCLCPAAATETNRFIFFFKCLVAEREKEIFFCFCFRSRAHWPLRTQQHTELSLATARSLEGRTSADRRAHTHGRERERDSAHSRTRAHGAPRARERIGEPHSPLTLLPTAFDRFVFVSFHSFLFFLSFFFFFFFFFSVCDAIALPHLVRLCPYSHSLLRDSSFANLLFVLGHLRAHREKKDPKQKNNSTFLGKKKKIQDGEISQSGWLR